MPPATPPPLAEHFAAMALNTSSGSNCINHIDRHSRQSPQADSIFPPFVNTSSAPSSSPTATISRGCSFDTNAFLHALNVAGIRSKYSASPFQALTFLKICPAVDVTDAEHGIIRFQKPTKGVDVASAHAAILEPNTPAFMNMAAKKGCLKVLSDTWTPISLPMTPTTPRTPASMITHFPSPIPNQSVYSILPLTATPLEQDSKSTHIIESFKNFVVKAEFFEVPFIVPIWQWMYPKAYHQRVSQTFPEATRIVGDRYGTIWDCTLKHNRTGREIRLGYWKDSMMWVLSSDMMIYCADKARKKKEAEDKERDEQDSSEDVVMTDGQQSAAKKSNVDMEKEQFLADMTMLLNFLLSDQCLDDF